MMANRVLADLASCINAKQQLTFLASALGSDLAMKTMLPVTSLEDLLSHLNVNLTSLRLCKLLTYPSCSAANVGIVAFGGGKAEIVQRALEVQSLPGALPAQLVRPTSGTLRWLLDCEAASQLNIPDWSNTKDFPRSQ